MKIVNDPRSIKLSPGEHQRMRTQARSLQQFMNVLQKASRDGGLPEGLLSVWADFRTFEQTLSLTDSLRDLEDAMIPADDFFRFASRMKAVGEILRHVEASAGASELPDSVARAWIDLKVSLKSEKR